MTLKNFIEKLQEIEKSVCYIAHPKLAGRLEFILDTVNNTFTLDLENIEVDQSWGCGCEIGAILTFKLNDSKVQDLLENYSE